MLALLLPLLAGTADAQTISKDTPVPNAVYADVNQAALGRLDTIIANFIPPVLDLDQQLDGIANGGGDLFDIGVIGATYDFGVEDVVVVPELRYADVVPRSGEVCRLGQGANTYYDNGYLDVDVQMDMSLSPPPNPPAHAYLDVTVELLGLISFDIANFDCDIRMIDEPARASIDVHIGKVIDSRTGCPDQTYDPDNPNAVSPYDCLPMDIQFGDLSWTFGEPDGSGNFVTTNLQDIDLDCGGLVNFLLDVASLFGIDPITLLIDTALPDLDDQIQELLTGVEDDARSTILDLFPPEDGYANVQTFELDQAALTIETCPTEFFVDERGLRFMVDAQFDFPPLPAPCVSQYDPGGSRRTTPPLPPRYTELGEYYVAGFGPNNPPQFALGVDDDLINKALYSLWYSGLLCINLNGSGTLDIELPIALDSSLIDLLSGGAFADLIPQPQPMLIVTRPERPPEFATSPSENVALVHLEDFGIDFYSEIDGRQVRLVGMDMAADAGVGVAFDGVVGAIGAKIDIDPAAIEANVVFNDLRPGASATIESGFGGILETVVDPLISSLIQDFEFLLPAIAGVGVESAYLTPAGPGSDFLGVFGSVGPVDYGDETLDGCDGCGGAGTGDCATGCSNGALPARLPFVLIPLLVAGLRRRDDRDDA